MKKEIKKEEIKKNKEVQQEISLHEEIFGKLNHIGEGNIFQYIYKSKTRSIKETILEISDLSGNSRTVSPSFPSGKPDIVKDVIFDYWIVRDAKFGKKSVCFLADDKKEVHCAFVSKQVIITYLNIITGKSWRNIDQVLKGLFGLKTSCNNGGARKIEKVDFSKI